MKPSVGLTKEVEAKLKMTKQVYRQLKHTHTDTVGQRERGVKLSDPSLELKSLVNYCGLDQRTLKQKFKIAEKV